MKIRILKTIVIAVIFLVLTSLGLGAFCTPAQFDETYFGELGYMYNRLKDTKDKKIVLIGNSALAFSLRTDLMQQELPDYKIVNFGLYGAIGTKAMLDLSRVNIGKGDIIIIMPERDDQSQSLFFSAENLWMAMDGNFSMLASLKWENAGVMAGNYFGFLSQKYGYLTSGKKPSVSGVYMQSSFDDEKGNEVGYMTYPRPYNVMPGGYDANNTISFSVELSPAFFSYLNDYHAFAKERGASVYYGFTPINKLSMADGTSEDTLNAYYRHLHDNLDFPLLGKPSDYIMDYEWFFDSNHHMNSAGMYVYTNQVLEDIKAELGIVTPNGIEIPQKPQYVPSQSQDGDNIDANLFTYESFEDGLKITGIKEEAKGKTSFIIPATYDGKPVRCFAENVFKGNTLVTQITVQSNLQLIYNNSFDGCSRLTNLIIEHENPNTLGIGTTLLQGANNCKIYVKTAVYDLFATHYNWGAYKNLLVKY